MTTYLQKRCGESVRWSVVECNYGKIYSKRFVCACETFDDARCLVDLLVERFKGRPFYYFIRPLINNEDIYDWEVSGSDLIDGTPYDYSEYLQGIYC